MRFELSSFELFCEWQVFIRNKLSTGTFLKVWLIIFSSEKIRREQKFSRGEGSVRTIIKQNIRNIQLRAKFSRREVSRLRDLSWADLPSRDLKVWKVSTHTKLPTSKLIKVSTQVQVANNKILRNHSLHRRQIGPHESIWRNIWIDKFISYANNSFNSNFHANFEKIVSWNFCHGEDFKLSNLVPRKLK